MQRAQGSCESLRLDRERQIGSGQLALLEPVVVEQRRPGMHDGPAHDAGKQETIRISHRHIFPRVVLHRIASEDFRPRECKLPATAAHSFRSPEVARVDSLKVYAIISDSQTIWDFLDPCSLFRRLAWHVPFPVDSDKPPPLVQFCLEVTLVKRAE